MRKEDLCEPHNYESVRESSRQQDSSLDKSPLNLSLQRRSVAPKQGTTSSTILLLDKQLNQLKKENRELKDRLDIAYKMQH
mmetsp:Transcript_27507/g.20664  ORF Transcript_27507/g.20664 Transcript_27507/m.20664 type:complete len:81 (+) Transcript_27507:232-474(+)|eukprot:CAMPEP_0202968818 /NCGR_PEP_ID=MMETSP1396-20130829/14273_1 /ASSEMBLY_ACC=CAM_ASM_000872 /TAXON_ID= /ORGANISM="Pseudokeronopsis sp., Strain Brazil" /LENGTH=80 /DNA_ID=CAMNT_0049695581 /DNA_START=157 /DNA_END=399 /DNA_ORIENTATION=+